MAKSVAPVRHALIFALFKIICATAIHTQYGTGREIKQEIRSSKRAKTRQNIQLGLLKHKYDTSHYLHLSMQFFRLDGEKNTIQYSTSLSLNMHYLR